MFSPWFPRDMAGSEGLDGMKVVGVRPQVGSIPSFPFVCVVFLREPSSGATFVS